MDKDITSVITNIGAIGVLALLVFRLPNIFQIINDGKKEMAGIMKEIQSEAYTNYAQNLQLIMKNSDTRVEKMEKTMEEMSRTINEQTTALRLMNERIIRDKEKT